MSTQLAELEMRVASLETSTRRWRIAATTLGSAALIVAATGFRQNFTPQTLEAERFLRETR